MTVDDKGRGWAKKITPLSVAAAALIVVIYGPAGTVLWWLGVAVFVGCVGLCFLKRPS